MTEPRIDGSAERASRRRASARCAAALATCLALGAVGCSSSSDDVASGGITTAAAADAPDPTALATTTSAVVATTAAPSTAAPTTTLAAPPDPLSSDVPIVFEVDVEVTEQGLGPFPPGTAFPNCYTLHPDGTWDDPGFPDVANPVPGTWETMWDGEAAGYVGTAEAGAFTIDQVADITMLDGGDLAIVADSTMLQDGELFLALVSTGSAVESCSLFDG